MNERRLCIQYPQLTTLSDKERKALLRRVKRRIGRDWRVWGAVLSLAGPALFAGIAAAILANDVPWHELLPRDIVPAIRVIAGTIGAGVIITGGIFIVSCVDDRVTGEFIIDELAALEQRANRQEISKQRDGI